MKTLRYVVAIVLITVACLGAFLDIRGLPALALFSWWLLADASEWTQPIPRKEIRGLFVILGFSLALVATLVFLHGKLNPRPSPPVRHFGATAVWLFCLWIIWRRWRNEKKRLTGSALQS